MPSSTETPQRSFAGSVIIVALIVVAAVLALSFVFGEADSDTAEPVSEQVQSFRTLIDPPDRVGFLDGLERRDGDGLADEFSDQQLLAWAVRFCEIGNGYINGSRPFISETLGAEIAAATSLIYDDAEGLASDIGNASTRTVCTVEVRSVDG